MNTLDYNLISEDEKKISHISDSKIKSDPSQNGLLKIIMIMVS